MKTNRRLFKLLCVLMSIVVLCTLELESRGAKFVNSVSKNLDVLFCGEKAGSKLTKAQQLCVRVADENELMEMLK